MSGIQVERIAGGRYSVAVSGDLASDAALAKLLSGSGLSYRYAAGNTITVYDPAIGPDFDAYDGSIVLEEVNVTAWVDGAAVGWDGSAETVYSTPASVGHISAETIAQFRGTTPGDILKGVPGLMTGASRSSGGIDPNIQGLQGMGRVAVTVDGASNEQTPSGNGGNENTVSKWSQMASADISNTSRFETGIGAAFLHEATAPGENGNSGFVARNGTRDEASVFTTGALVPTDWLRLEGGLRYHYYRAEDTSGASTVVVPSREGGAWDYSVGASVTPTEGVQLFANYQNAARMPALFESISNGLVGIDPELGPERASRWEVGGNLTMNGLLADEDALKLKLAYFNNTEDDYIYRQAYRPEGATTTTLTVTNLEQAKFSGIELSGQYDIGGFSATLAATYYDDIEFCRTADTCINSSLASDYAANHIPPEIVTSLTLSQKLLDDRLTISGRATYYGGRAAAAGDPAG